MTTQSKTRLSIRNVPLSALVISALNVRKEKDSKAELEELAALIEAEGVIQNLVGFESSGGRGKRRKQFEVVAGGRRLQALQLLQKRGKVKPSLLVPLREISRERAVAVSLAENLGRKQLHPADAFEAFRALVDAGESIEEVAARFNVSPIIVKQRLKLAKVAPEFIQMYREKAVLLDHLMALASTDDHELQRQSWKSFAALGRSPSPDDVRHALTQREVRANDPIARFVTVAAYQKAGGQCRHDLFMEEDNVFLLDPDLLSRLATEKLQKRAAQLKKQGDYAWIECSLRRDLSELAKYRRVAEVEREFTDDEKAQLSTVDQELLDVEAQIESEEEKPDSDAELLNALYKQRNELEDRKDELESSRYEPDPAQRARAGAVIYVDRTGEIVAQADLLRPEDARELQSRPAASVTNRVTNGTSVTGNGERAHSAALLQRLTAHRTLALRALFSRTPDVAFTAIVHTLALPVFYGRGEIGRSVVGIKAPTVDLDQYADDLKSSKACVYLESVHAELEKTLPGDPDALFGWLLNCSLEQKLALLCFCVAQSIDCVQNDERHGDGDRLAKALGMDMREWWQATASGYLKSIKKDLILQAVAEGASAETAHRIQVLKKADLVVAAEQALANSGWLPPFMRGAWAPIESSVGS